jgi:hypothetical protein
MPFSIYFTKKNGVSCRDLFGIFSENQFMPIKESKAIENQPRLQRKARHMNGWVGWMSCGLAA